MSWIDLDLEIDNGMEGKQLVQRLLNKRIMSKSKHLVP